MGPILIPTIPLKVIIYTYFSFFAIKIKLNQIVFRVIHLCCFSQKKTNNNNIWSDLIRFVVSSRTRGLRVFNNFKYERYRYLVSVAAMEQQVSAACLKTTPTRGVLSHQILQFFFLHKKLVKFYQIITYIRVTMRCARTAVTQCMCSPWLGRTCWKLLSTEDIKFREKVRNNISFLIQVYLRVIIASWPRNSDCTRVGSRSKLTVSGTSCNET